ncbi:hypothetical protein [Desulfosarcina sp.]|uniref:hypothetical protein n=1 Tax=Desulfosarcina sp. TaxID=2027861 RepID=UPI0029A689BE|nr:hypothetical protein [Desulfosarcina sp.]MDX2452594.1 hypothetical protein [Desulfosarcina sp.]MDX2494359.1 hypothetical protein [Desulfuromusa sp.]
MPADFSTPAYVNDLNFAGHHASEHIVFTVTLSIENNEEVTLLTSLEETMKSQLNDKKVLVVDDSKMIRLFVR